uniref:DNA binding protein n=1 Tax=Solanum tuberosum TaxID=4113 RepID=M1DWD5_SOLTU
MLSKTCLLKTSEAKIVREKPNYFICERDWPQFVVHHQLEASDILIFSLIEKSTFHVQPYTPKSCRNITHERQHFYEELSSSSSEEEIGPSKRAKKMEPIIVVSDTEEESVDMSSSDDDDPPYSHRATYYKNPKREKVSSDQKDEEAHSGSEAYGLKRNSRCSLVTFNSHDDYYEIVVKKSHTTFMTIPMGFAKRTGIINMKKMRLINDKGKKEWEVEIVHTGPRVIIKNGWAEFRTHNKIANGETCRFKLIQGHATASVLQVQNVPRPHSLQYF